MGGEGLSAMSGAMSREDRKNQEIARMIKRQEELQKKREEKNKLKVSTELSCHLYTQLTSKLWHRFSTRIKALQMVRTAPGRLDSESRSLCRSLQLLNGSKLLPASKSMWSSPTILGLKIAVIDTLSSKLIRTLFVH